MKITEKTVRQVTITDVEHLDPIRVIIEDYEPGQGRITITCWDESWVNFWGHMGNGANIETFFMRASADYLAGKLSNGIKREVFDGDKAEEACRRQVLKDRRAGDIDSDTARDLWDRINMSEWPDDMQYNSDLFYDVFGDEWWSQLPEKPNHKWQHMISIVTVIKAAFAQLNNKQPEAA
jgi:hypothetical protein